jgi:hypothetical protein
MNTDAASEMRQLQLARDRMQALLNGLPDAVLGLDPAGRVVLISPSAASVFGLDTSRLADLTHARRPVHAQQRHARGALRGRRAARATAPSSRPRCRCRAPRPAGVAHYTCVVRDITEQRMTFRCSTCTAARSSAPATAWSSVDMKLPGGRCSTPTRPSARITGYEPWRGHRPQLRFLQRDDRDQPEPADAARRHGRRPSARWCCATTARTARCSSTNWRSRR